MPARESPMLSLQGQAVPFELPYQYHITGGAGYPYYYWVTYFAAIYRGCCVVASNTRSATESGSREGFGGRREK